MKRYIRERILLEIIRDMFKTFRIKKRRIPFNFPKASLYNLFKTFIYTKEWVGD